MPPKKLILGKGFLDKLKKVNAMVKKSGIAGKMLPGQAGVLAKSMGYGRKKRVIKKPAVMGKGFFGNIWKGVKKGVKTAAKVGRAGVALGAKFHPGLAAADSALSMAGHGRSSQMGGRRVVRISNMEPQTRILY